MSFPVKFLNFKKRENSTKVPSAAELTGAASYNCTLLESTSLMNPTFKISMNVGNISLTLLNKCYINAAGTLRVAGTKAVYWFPCIANRRYKAEYDNTITYAFYTDEPQLQDTSYNGSRVYQTTDMNIIAPITGYCCIEVFIDTTITVHEPQYNYCYCPQFERFYFVNDITSDKNFWYISCSCDTLGSYRDEILPGSHYVLRSASAYDEYIGDSAYISKTKQTGTFQSFTNPFSYASGHSYVWCITGDVINGTVADTQIGSNVYYWMNDAECYTFIDYLLNNVDTWSGINTSTEYSAAMQKALLNPIQYVNSVILLPFGKNDTLATNNDVQFGYYTITISGSPTPSVKRVTQGTMINTTSVDISIPKHPQASTYGKYMNAAPYTEYQLFLGPFGTIPLDPASLIDETYITLTCNTEVATGSCQIFVRGKTSNVMIYTGTAQVGVPVTVSQITRDMLGELQNNLNQQTATAGALASVALGGLGSAQGIAGNVMQIGGMAFDAVRLKYPTCTGGGSNGSFLSLHTSCYLDATFFECTARNTAEIGRPLHQTKTLSTLSGYCLCQNADVVISGTADEVRTVNGYLNSGFFIE